MQMARWICSISLSEERPSEKIGDKNLARNLGHYCGHGTNVTLVVWTLRKDRN